MMPDPWQTSEANCSFAACAGQLRPPEQNTTGWGAGTTEGDWKSKVKMTDSLVPNVGSLPSVQSSAFSLCPRMAGKEREKDTNPTGSAPHPYDLI